MNKTRNSLLAVVAVAAMSLLGANAAFASGYVHSANSEKGYVTQPEHFKSERSRAEIQAEAAEFAKKGVSDRFRDSNYPPNDMTQASTKTRAEVTSEFLNMSAAQRKAMNEMYRGN